MSSSRPEPAPRAQSVPGPGGSAGGSGGGARPDPTPLIHDADDLLGGNNLALIVLGAQTYRLRLTRQGKLILNK